MRIEKRSGLRGRGLWEIRGDGRIKEGLARRHRVHEPNGTKSRTPHYVLMGCHKVAQGCPIVLLYAIGLIFLMSSAHVTIRTMVVAESLSR